jgi:hypothetical protein
LEAALQDNRVEKNGHRGLQNSGHWEIKIVRALQQGDEAEVNAAAAARTTDLNPKSLLLQQGDEA